MESTMPLIGAQLADSMMEITPETILAGKAKLGMRLDIRHDV
jgi:hypothetical protein